MALPGSIIDNAQSHELRTALAGQVARALVIFNVDEVVVFDEQTRLAAAAPTGSALTTFRSCARTGKGKGSIVATLTSF